MSASLLWIALPAAPFPFLSRYDDEAAKKVTANRRLG